MLILPDILLCLLPFVVLATDLFFNPRTISSGLSRRVGRPAGRFPRAVFRTARRERAVSRRFRIAPWSLLLKQIFVAGALATAWLSAPYFENRLEHPRLTRGGEFFTMLTFCVTA